MSGPTSTKAPLAKSDARVAGQKPIQREQSDPPVRSSDVLALQRAAGNTAVSALLSGRSHAPGMSTAKSADATRGAVPAPPAVGAVLRTTGEPLDADTRALMQRSFDYDFSQVRVHASTAAVESARSMGASAYTLQNHIVFDAGEYTPHTVRGRQLLAHELAHVIQQSRGGAANPSRSPGLERDADHAASTLALDAGPVTVAGASGPAIQCQSKKTEPAKPAKGQVFVEPDRGAHILRVIWMTSNGQMTGLAEITPTAGAPLNPTSVLIHEEPAANQPIPTVRMEIPAGWQGRAAPGREVTFQVRQSKAEVEAEGRVEQLRREMLEFLEENSRGELAELALGLKRDYEHMSAKELMEAAAASEPFQEWRAQRAHRKRIAEENKAYQRVLGAVGGGMELGPAEAREIWERNVGRIPRTRYEEKRAKEGRLEVGAIRHPDTGVVIGYREQHLYGGFRELESSEVHYKSIEGTVIGGSEPSSREEALEQGAQMILELIPIVGEVVMLAQAIAGRELVTGRALTVPERTMDGALAVLPYVGQIINAGAKGAKAVAAAAKGLKQTEVAVLMRALVEIRGSELVLREAIAARRAERALAGAERVEAAATTQTPSKAAREAAAARKPPDFLAGRKAEFSNAPDIASRAPARGDIYGMAGPPKAESGLTAVPGAGKPGAVRIEATIRERVEQLPVRPEGDLKARTDTIVARAIENDAKRIRLQEQLDALPKPDPGATRAERLAQHKLRRAIEEELSALGDVRLHIERDLSRIELEEVRRFELQWEFTPVGNTDAANRRFLGLPEKSTQATAGRAAESAEIADFLGKDASGNWRIMESKGSDADKAVRQMRNTHNALVNKDPSAAGKVSFDYHVDQSNYGRLSSPEGVGQSHYRVDSEGFLVHGEKAPFVRETIDGVGIKVTRQ